MEKRLHAHRLFVAILPPPGAIERIGPMRDMMGHRSPITDAHLHITMGLLDDRKTLEDDVVIAAKTALSSVRNGAVRICLDRISSNRGFTGLRPSETSQALIDLQRKIASAFVDVGLPFASHWSFHPHMTLLRSGTPRPDEQVDAVSWRADELALVHSLVGLTRHIVLQRVPLVG